METFKFSGIWRFAREIHEREPVLEGAKGFESRARIASNKFEDLFREVLSVLYNTYLTRHIEGVPKVFDIISENGKVVGGAKYLTMVRGEPIPPARFSMTPEHSRLLEKISTNNKFLVSGNDRRVPEEWLKRYGHRVMDEAFFFLGEETGELEKVS